MSGLIDTAASLVLSTSRKARGSRTAPELMTYVSPAIAYRRANHSLIEFERNRGRERVLAVLARYIEGGPLFSCLAILCRVARIFVIPKARYHEPVVEFLLLQQYHDDQNGLLVDGGKDLASLSALTSLSASISEERTSDHQRFSMFLFQVRSKVTENRGSRPLS